MPFSAGPNIAARPNLVFEYDTGDVQNSYRGKPTTNFYTNGQFANGAGIPQEQGSNPTNTIIFFPNNPGNSQYVLQQNGNYTEYQIDLTSQLVSNTTYVMSGWYAQSSDYNGSPTMFHARAFSASGNHNATGTGLGTILTTRTVGNTTWSYCYQTITTPSDYSNYFNWYVGYGQPSHNGYRYYTNLQMELGSFPSQFVDGTRSATQGLLDVSGQGNLINLSNVSFTNTAFPQMYFDGTDDLITLGSINQYFAPQVGGVSTETVFLITPGASGNDGPLFENYRYNVWYVYGSDLINFYTRTGPPTYPSYAFAVSMQSSIACRAKGLYNHLVSVYETISGGTGKVSLYINGQAAGTSTGLEMGNYPLFDPMIGQSYHGGYGTFRLNGQVPITRVYNRALSAQEVLRNYNQLKGRFNLI